MFVYMKASTIEIGNNQPKDYLWEIKKRYKMKGSYHDTMECERCHLFFFPRGIIGCPKRKKVYCEFCYCRYIK